MYEGEIMLVGERLISLRKEKKLTQKQLSDLLIINYRTYGSYERNEIDANDDVKIQLANFYNVSLDYLLGLTDIPKPLKSNDYNFIRVPASLSPDKMKIINLFIKFLIAQDNENNK